MIWDIVAELMFCLQLFVAQLLFMAGKKRRKFFYAKLLVILSVCITFFIFVPSDTVALECVKYIVGFVVLLVFVLLCYDVNLNYGIFVSVCAYAMQHISYCLTEIIRNLYDIPGNFTDWILEITDVTYEGYMNIYMPANIFATTVIFSAVYAVMYCIFIKKLRKDVSYNVGRLSQMILSVSILTSTMIINLLYRRLFPDIPSEAVISLRAFAIISCAFAIVIQMRTHERDKLAENNLILDHLLYEEAKRHEMSKKNIELINIKCHDLKKQINTLKLVASEEEKARNIEEIEKAVMIYDNIAKTGNESLDVVLTENSLICNKRNIKLSYIVDGQKLKIMQSGDIYTMFSNAFDNAIESVSKLSEEKRVVSLRVTCVNEMLLIKMLNYYEGDLVFENGFPKTTGEDSGYHGFGLRSIAYIAEKYGGNFCINARDNLFEINILIPLNKK